jgi:para-nitrobenzyl esterase
VLAQYPAAAYGPNPFDAAAAVSGDFYFTCPTRRLARLLAANPHASNVPTYLYQYDHMPSWIKCPGPTCSQVPLGVQHGAEMPFVFGYVQYLYTPDEAVLSAALIRDWASLAIRHTPESGTLHRTRRIGALSCVSHSLFSPIAL